MRRFILLMLAFVFVQTNGDAVVILDFGSDTGKVSGGFSMGGGRSGTTAGTLSDSIDITGGGAGGFATGWQSNTGFSIDTSTLNGTDLLQITIQGDVGGTVNPVLAITFFEGSFGSEQARYNFDISSISSSGFTTYTAATPLNNPDVGTFSGTVNWGTYQIFADGGSGGTSAWNIQVDEIATVPEPSSYALLLFGTSLMLFYSKRLRASFRN
ncbi:MAG: PEP-CTERM sorting domain-containing protein [Verrucomicrobiota bacterium]